jgi:hypothetical protein
MTRSEPGGPSTPGVRRIAGDWRHRGNEVIRVVAIVLITRQASANNSRPSATLTAGLLSTVGPFQRTHRSSSRYVPTSFTCLCAGGVRSLARSSSARPARLRASARTGRRTRCPAPRPPSPGWDSASRTSIWSRACARTSQTMNNQTLIAVSFRNARVRGIGRRTLRDRPPIRIVVPAMGPSNLLLNRLISDSWVDSRSCCSHIEQSSGQRPEEGPRRAPTAGRGLAFRCRVALVCPGDDTTTAAAMAQLHPTRAPTETSLNQCTPRATLDHATAVVNASASAMARRRHLRSRRSSASVRAAAAAKVAWPEGNANPLAIAPGGRGRCTSRFTTCDTASAPPMATAAVTNGAHVRRR